MADIDPTVLIQAITDLATIFLVTLPSIFISTALNGGVLFTIFTTLFDEPEVFHVIVILALSGGVYLWFKSMDGTKSLRKGKMR